VLTEESPRGCQSGARRLISPMGGLALDTKTVLTTIVVVLGVVEAVSLLPDLVRYMKIRSM